ncbi:polysaccharide deacetylase family protein [Listeria booriae]|nr:polysaccharide deacetylase family protein [Listeria booriae]MBC1226501.1 polysaccharide deacetylase [Listeria booriae]MBC1229938.1 polysaccharide deacetylase [Listeria booriae]MBC1233288.1 polysaccharide deacetylase [Listeria booriae]MBC1245291.1 polysaccharide deacetylase [Listeria booriae]MBC1272009.1 polysaccharide deacetylase [Listeria booriae]
MRQNRRTQATRKKTSRLKWLIAIVIATFVLTIGGLVITKNLFSESASSKDILELKAEAVTVQHWKVSDMQQPLKAVPKTPPGPAAGKKVAYLTFDDGPSVHLKGFLDILEKEKVPSSFFFVGNEFPNADKATYKRMIDNGFVIGLHSYTHDAKQLYRKNNPTFITEMSKERDKFEEISGIRTNLIRAPYGSTYLSQQQVEQTKQNGFRLVDWNIDSNDWRYSSGNSGAVYQNVLSQVNAYAGSNEPLVILFHERKNTLEALPKVIKMLRDKGYTFQAYHENETLHENFKKDPNL